MFPKNKTESLKHAYYYRRAYKRGNSAVTKDLGVYVMRNGLESNRLGISVKRSVGKSVERNRLRRLIKENYRFLGPELKNGYDIVFVVRKSESKVSFWDVRDSMGYMLRKLNILRRDV